MQLFQMSMMSLWLVVCLVFVLLGLCLSKNCVDVIDVNGFTGECTKKWKNLKPILKPTQPQVGYSWIKYKLDKDFDKESNAQDAIDPIPAVIGPGPYIYIVDDHHTLCALDYSGFEDVSVTVNILCDKRNSSVESFWSDMSEQNLAYLAAHPAGKPNSLPTAISYKTIPSSFSFSEKEKVFSNDPWRSLAGYSRKVQEAPAPAPTCNTDKGDSKYCERCMFRGCNDGYQNNGQGVSYFEFRWSYYMNDATYFHTSYWTSSEELKSFKSDYEEIYDEDDIDKIDPDDWMKLAESVISLCRGSSTASYSLPSELYPTSSSLPGYVQGYEKLAEDPSCSLPICK